jgi:hypothetical protein
LNFGLTKSNAWKEPDGYAAGVVTDGKRTFFKDLKGES